ncbi:hypothetical protein SRHO_G00338140 [Serrasalmus rhombeus]
MVQSTKRADPNELKVIFQKYSSVVDKDGERFMTPSDFVQKFLGLHTQIHHNPKLCSCWLEWQILQRMG